TPLISDPGLLLVRAVQSAGFYVCSIPGASAVITAFSISTFGVQQLIYIKIFIFNLYIQKSFLTNSNQWWSCFATMVFNLNIRFGGTTFIQGWSELFFKYIS
ncbi:MAG: hypothetical protein Q8830_03610, partial [Candidatus Phytoplasma australasiaticum]|nr:hypothetical protein [Candidatus Phytoplasma australasiaticum]